MFLYIYAMFITWYLFNIISKFNIHCIYLIFVVYDLKILFSDFLGISVSLCQYRSKQCIDYSMFRVYNLRKFLIRFFFYYYSPRLHRPFPEKFISKYEEGAN